jgi:hypothetical protein
MPLPTPADTARNLQALAERWAASTASERAGFQSWMLEWLEALGAEQPLPPTPEHQFELPVRVVDREGRESVNFIDYWKAGHVAGEAKAIGAVSWISVEAHSIRMLDGHSFEWYFSRT